MTKPKRNPGLPKHEPTQAQRKMVESMSAYGIPQEDISKVVGIDRKTLAKYYREELDTATAKANSRVAQSLYNKALGDGASSVTAAIFWLKTRGGWKETTVVEGKIETGVSDDLRQALDAIAGKITSSTGES